MNIQKSENQHRAMTNGNIRMLILRFAAPTGIGMIVTALYSLADAFFVSDLSTEASAAVGVSFAIQALLQAVGYTLGMGAGSLISRSLGKRENDIAANLARIAFWISLICGCLIAVLGIAFLSPLMRLLGATAEVLPFARSYASYLLLSSPFMCTAFVLSQLLRAEGKAIYSMLGLVGGSLLNIALDPLLIKNFGMGVSGASLATLISQIFSTVILLSAYISGHSQIQLFKRIEPKKMLLIFKILTAGLPSTFRQGLTVLATVSINRVAGLWGDAALVALSVITRLFLLAFSLCLGVGQGMMPVAGYNYGFGKLDRVKNAYIFSIFLSCAAMLLFSIPVIIWAPQLIAFFRNDPQVIQIGAVGLRVQGAVFVLHGVITCTIMLLQAIGKPIRASILACARQGLFFIPLIYLLPLKFGNAAVLYIQPIADALTFFFSILFVFYALKHLKAKKQPAEMPNRLSPQKLF